MARGVSAHKLTLRVGREKAQARRAESWSLDQMVYALYGEYLENRRKPYPAEALEAYRAKRDAAGLVPREKDQNS